MVRCEPVDGGQDRRLVATAVVLHAVRDETQRRDRALAREAFGRLALQTIEEPHQLDFVGRVIPVEAGSLSLDGWRESGLQSQTSS
jgi:hypothetical protein